MRRGRGKGKKSTPNHGDPGSGEEEKIPAQKRRGRPQKPVKDEIDEEEEIEMLEKDDDDDEIKSPIKFANGTPVAETGKKRKRSLQVKESPPSPIKATKGVGSANSNTNDSIKSNGYRHIGSRRKSKPRRAAEVGVECN
ncbi:hypothetical protein Dimus_011685 [Dionaea muscipula]